jgi:hypothetical protein
VKWDAQIIDWEEREDCIWILFDTAWGAPIQLYEYLSDKGWHIEALYSEPGMCFCGSYTTEDAEDYYEYGDYLDDLDRLKEIPEDIFEFANLQYQHESHMEHLAGEDDE